MTSNFQHSRRAVYRVVYPIRERPTFTIEFDSYPVIDCSELGLRYLAPADHKPEVGTTISGRVHFRRGSEVPVTGEVVRVDDGTVALWFRSQAIPLSEMLAERTYLDSAADEPS
jgi:hypothetical protein